MEEIPHERKESFKLPIGIKYIEANHFRQICTQFYRTSCCEGYPQIWKKVPGIISVAFDTTGQLLIIYSEFVKYLKKMGIK
jgi:hypothetical protein